MSGTGRGSGAAAVAGDRHGVDSIAEAAAAVKSHLKWRRGSDRGRFRRHLK